MVDLSWTGTQQESMWCMAGKVTPCTESKPTTILDMFRAGRRCVLPYLWQPHQYPYGDQGISAVSGC